jgi:hypothetical protein
MDISIGNILGFLVLLFVINGLAVGLGVADDSWSNKINILGDDTNYTNLEDQYQSNDLSIIASEDAEDTNSATTDSTIITGVPFSSNITTQGTTFWDLLKGLTFGYAAIIFLLPIGQIMTWILVGVVGFLQFAAIFYLLLYLFSVIRGGGGI